MGLFEPKTGDYAKTKGELIAELEVCRERDRSGAESVRKANELCDQFRQCNRDLGRRNLELERETNTARHTRDGHIATIDMLREELAALRNAPPGAHAMQAIENLRSKLEAAERACKELRQGKEKLSAMCSEHTRQAVIQETRRLSDELRQVEKERDKARAQGASASLPPGCRIEMWNDGAHLVVDDPRRVVVAIVKGRHESNFTSAESVDILIPREDQ